MLSKATAASPWHYTAWQIWQRALDTGWVISAMPSMESIPWAGQELPMPFSTPSDPVSIQSSAHCTLPTLLLHYCGGDSSASLPTVFPSYLPSHPSIPIPSWA